VIGRCENMYAQGSLRGGESWGGVNGALMLVLLNFLAKILVMPSTMRGRR
jgi:hypothetical protein